jgi:hypothetical protein
MYSGNESLKHFWVRLRMVEMKGMISSLMKTLRTLFLTTFVVVLAAASALAADPNGAWKYTVQGLKGQSIESTLTLKYDNNQLSGNVDNRAGKAEIKDGKFTEDQISFSVVRKLRHHEFTTHYAGKLEGDTITGTVQTTGRDDNPISIPWVAKRAK